MYVFRADLLALETLDNKSKADFSEVLIFSFHFFTALLTSLLYSVCGLLFHMCVIFSFTLMSLCTYKEKPWILHYKEVKFWCLAGKHCASGNDFVPKLSTSTYKQWNVHKLLSPWVLIVTCQRRDLLSLAGRPRLLLLPSAVTFNKNINFWHWQFWIQWLPSLKDSERKA